MANFLQSECFAFYSGNSHDIFELGYQVREGTLKQTANLKGL